MSGLLQSRWAPRPGDSGKPPSSSRGSTSSSFSSSFSITGSHAPDRDTFTGATSGSRSGITTTSSSIAAGTANAAQELSRFTKLVARLKWKLPFLEEGYQRATQHPTSEMQDTDTDINYAETMFKIDFHEYYALLERAIVHLLGVFGIQVSSTPSRKWHGRKTGQGVQWNTTALSMGPGGAPSRSGGHSYHANVLETLEDPSCPLHEVLGCGIVYEQLRKAKELRNRWKTADMSEEEQEADRWRRRPMLPLESYDFDQILTEIFGGLEEGYLLAQAHVARVGGDTANGDLEMEMDGDWDFIVDAMDWEAI